MDDLSLIIEGGGLRGFFSAGALQALLDDDIRIPYVIGVSSGSLTALAYASNGLDAFVSLTGSRQRFFRWRNLVDDERGVLDTDRFFRAAADQFETFRRSGVHLELAATRAADARQVFFSGEEIGSQADLLAKLKASAAIPVLMDRIRVNGEVYVDGGIIDSVPVTKAIRDGKTRHIILATRPPGYRKGPQRMEYFLRKWLRPYPQLKVAMQTRHIRYNQMMSRLETLETEALALVIRPASIRQGRLEYDPVKFQIAYRDGYQAVVDRLEEIRRFIEASKDRRI